MKKKQFEINFQKIKKKYYNLPTLAVNIYLKKHNLSSFPFKKYRKKLATGCVDNYFIATHTPVVNFV